MRGGACEGEGRERYITIPTRDARARATREEQIRETQALRPNSLRGKRREESSIRPGQSFDKPREGGRLNCYTLQPNVCADADRHDYVLNHNITL